MNEESPEYAAARNAHAYLDCGSDIILTDEQARARLAH